MAVHGPCRLGNAREDVFVASVGDGRAKPAALPVRRAEANDGCRSQYPPVSQGRAIGLKSDLSDVPTRCANIRGPRRTLPHLVQTDPLGSRAAAARASPSMIRAPA